jgi:formylglycine-generating enzyme
LSAWRAKIARSRELESRLHELLDRACLDDPALHRDYEELIGLTGDSGPDRAWWKQHLAELAEPGKPEWASNYDRDRHGWYATVTLGKAAFLLRWVPAGRFVMGSPLDEAGRDGDETPVEVTLSRGFWLAETETTQRQWYELMGTQPSYRVGDDHPVERVSWVDANAACTELNRRVAGLYARLPSEAEWEYACRAESSAPFSSFQGGLTHIYAESVAWLRSNSTSHEKVRQRLPNRLGLYDMHGNVWEWCNDHYSLYSPLPIIDPVGTASRTRVIRGGSWGDSADRCRAANRQHAAETMTSAYLGFRIVVQGSMDPVSTATIR